MCISDFDNVKNKIKQNRMEMDGWMDRWQREKGNERGEKGNNNM
jgi:hypothetical protein